MKKIIAILIMISMWTIFLTENSYAKTIYLNYDGINHKYSGSFPKVKVNNKIINSDVPVVVLKTFTMISARVVFEELGGEVTWNKVTQVLTINIKDKVIVFKADDIYAVVNGNKVKMATQAKMINERLMINLIFVSEILGMKYSTFPKENLITLDYKQLFVGSFKGISYYKEAEKDLIKIDVENYKSSTVMRLTGTDRIVIDIPNIEVSKLQKVININSLLIRSVRYSQFSGNICRIVLDVNGQPQFEVQEDKNGLTIFIENPTYKNITYSNHNDRVTFLLNNARLTEGGVNFTKLYEGEYDETGKKYTVSFPGGNADLGSGVVKINDHMIDTIEINTDPNTNKTTITFNSKNKYVYNIFTRSEVGNTAVTIVKPAAKAQRLVVIDPGHGGSEPGAISKGVYEKSVNLAISMKLNSLLKKKNINTYMMREDDSYVNLYERTQIANNLNAVLFLSVHNNALTDPNFAGTMTLYYPAFANYTKFSSKDFAQIIQKKLLQKLHTKDRKVIKRPYLVVLRDTKMTAALAEVGFLTNKAERANLQSNSFQQKAAEALSDSIIEALKQIK